MVTVTRFLISASCLTLLVRGADGVDDLPKQDVAKEIQQALQDATKAAGDIPDGFERAIALAHIGQTQRLLGAKEVAQQTFRKAAMAARTLPASNQQEARERCSAFFIIARHIAASHDWAGARSFVDDVVKDEPLKQFRGVPEYEVRGLNRTIMAFQARAGQWDEAWKTAQALEDQSTHDYLFQVKTMQQAEAKEWDLALESAGQIHSESTRAATVAGIAIAQHQAGRKDEARQLVQKVRKIMEGMAVDSSRYVRARLAGAYAEMGDRKAALEMMELVTDGKLPDWYREATMVRVHLKLGDVAHGLTYARKAREISAPIEYPFREVVAAQLKAKRFEEAWQTAEEIKNDYIRVQAMLDVGEAQHRAGLRDAAADTFRLALLSAEKAPLEIRFRLTFASDPADLFGKIFAIQAELGDAVAARAWIGQQIAAKNQAYALVGLAEGLHKRHLAATKK